MADADLPPPIYGELKRHLEWDGYAMDARAGCAVHRPAR